MPGPDLAPVHPGLMRLEADGQPRLLGGRCTSCASHHFPLAARCPYCAAPGPQQVPLSRQGRLWAWTAVHTPPPGYLGRVPFGFGVVELPEGLRVIARLTQADPSRLSFGQPMRLVLDDLHTDEEGRQVVTYAFAEASQ